MIEVKVIRNRIDCYIEVKGHANYAPVGQDIVCAAVSVLYQNMLESIEQLTHDVVHKTSYQDIQEVRIKGNSKTTNILVDSFLIGVKDIATSYPDHVKVK